MALRQISQSMAMASDLVVLLPTEPSSPPQMAT